jgi:starch phosphorylase
MKHSDPSKDRKPGTSYSIEIQAVLPVRFARLGELANDLYYSWSRSVRALFRHLDPESWDAAEHNPRVFLRRIRQDRIDGAVEDPILLTEFRHVLSTYDTYLEERPTTRIDEYLDRNRDLVAYFSAEYGFHESMPIYAGGLGILAADYCKAMSNLRVPFVGIGILYHEGYFRQRIGCDGTQFAESARKDPCDLPVTPALDSQGDEVHVHVKLAGRHVELKVWQVRAGHIRLYLLDSDIPANSNEDRLLTAQLYGGGNETRIQQEIILGIGGVRALRTLGLEPTVWHVNEGHAAFLILERCLEHVHAGMDFETAFELVSAGTAFTTHTPVPAGHDVFTRDVMHRYFKGKIRKLGISEERFLELGASPRNPDGFSMTSLAMRGSRFRNGVSRIHGDVAAEMESYIWPGIEVGENPVGYITNGADVDTYLARSWSTLFEMYKGGGWRARLVDTGFWEEFIDTIPDHVFMSIRQLLKSSLLEEVRRRAIMQYERCGQTKSLTERLTRYLVPQNTDTLIIGFARRFATYKRAGLLFEDLDRLARLLDDPERPVICLFAGKAHPDDAPGQALLKQVFDISMRPEFQGKIILLENYNLSLARELLPGVDVWLNTPEYPLEACGTSGMKAAINGAINLSVLDGWWAEAWNGQNGWGITPHPEFDPATRRQMEADELLNILEYQVIPRYFARNSDGEREAWIRASKDSMKSVLPGFNTIRMAIDYLRDSYAPAARGGRLLHADNAAGARELAQWKQKVASGWHGVQARLAEPVARTIHAGERLSLDVAVHLNGLEPEDIFVECVVDNDSVTGEDFLLCGVPLFLAGQTDTGEALYHGELFDTTYTCMVGGLQKFRIRIYPCHDLLSHPFECGQMLWL